MKNQWEAKPRRFIEPTENISRNLKISDIKSLQYHAVPSSTKLSKLHLLELHLRELTPH